MNVNTPNTIRFFATLVGTMQYASEIEASFKFVAMLPNGGNVPDTSAIGHPDGTGESVATNAFGDAFAEAGNKWTKELCEADTDGDGQTNGQELGDPCCEWDKNTNPVVQWTDGVSHPDDDTKTSDESLWANIVCGSSSASVSETSKATEVVEGSSSANGSTASSSTNSKTSSTPTSTSITPTSSQSPSNPNTSSASNPTRSIIGAVGIVTMVSMILA